MQEFGEFATLLLVEAWCPEHQASLAKKTLSQFCHPGSFFARFPAHDAGNGLGSDALNAFHIWSGAAIDQRLRPQTALKHVGVRGYHR